MLDIKNIIERIENSPSLFEYFANEAQEQANNLEEGDGINIDISKDDWNYMIFYQLFNLDILTEEENEILQNDVNNDYVNINMIKKAIEKVIDSIDLDVYYEKKSYDDYY